MYVLNKYAKAYLRKMFLLILQAVIRFSDKIDKYVFFIKTKIVSYKN